MKVINKNNNDNNVECHSEYPQFGPSFDQPCQCEYSCFVSWTKFGLTIQFDWGLPDQVDHLQHVVQLILFIIFFV